MSEIFESLQHPVQKISGCFAIFANSLLIYLINFHSPKTLGAYRYLMMYISIFEILYALLDLLISPILYSTQSGLMAILDAGRSGMPIELLYVLNIVFCGSFGTSMAIFGIHFVFRYLIMKGSKQLTSSNPLTVFVWLMIPIVYGVIWSLLCMTTLFPTEQSDQFLIKTYLQKYPREIQDLTYFGPYFYPNGTLDWKPCLGIAGCTAIMSISSLTMVFCGAKCYNRIHNLVQVSAQSKHHNKLQRQFLLALIVETLVPVFLMHVPAGLAYAACIMDSSHEILGQVLTMSIALYPALDPIPTMVIIGNYRNAILRFVGGFGSKFTVIQKFMESMADVGSEEEGMDIL